MTRSRPTSPPPLSVNGLTAIVFDMDGVVTDTAGLHARCWKQVFDEYLRARSTAGGGAFDPFTDDDYLRFVDGKPRYEGAASFLWSRGFDVPWGDPSDPPGRGSVCSLANLKDREFEVAVHAQTVRSFPSTRLFIEEARAHAIRTALISSSRHATAIIKSAGMMDLFDAIIDGVEAEARGLPGKPDPAIFLAAAEALDVAPARAAVVEDALAGVEAGRRGGFGLVVGIDRHGHPRDLRRHGADIVVRDLSELEPEALVAMRSA